MLESDRFRTKDLQDGSSGVNLGLKSQTISHQIYLAPDASNACPGVSSGHEDEPQLVYCSIEPTRMLFNQLNAVRESEVIDCSARPLSSAANGSLAHAVVVGNVTLLPSCGTLERHERISDLLLLASQLGASFPSPSRIQSVCSNLAWSSSATSSVSRSLRSNTSRITSAAWTPLRTIRRSRRRGTSPAAW